MQPPIFGPSRGVPWPLAFQLFEHCLAHGKHRAAAAIRVTVVTATVSGGEGSLAWQSWLEDLRYAALLPSSGFFMFPQQLH